MVNTTPVYSQTHLFAENHALISSKVEDHWFDRKSFRVAPENLANLLVGFANADGGTILVGVENDGAICRVDSDADHLNRLRQAAIDFTMPPVRHAVSLIQYAREDGSATQVLSIEIPPGSGVHRNHRDEVYLRIGDQNRRLSHEATQELLYDKGQTVFDGSLVSDATLLDLDDALLKSFIDHVGSTAAVERVLRARGLVVERGGVVVPTHAAILLFGEFPERFLPGAFIRIVRYEGDEIRVGTRSNLIQDLRIEGALPVQIGAAEEALQRSIRSVIRLNSQTGRFETVPELPRFAWLEAVVNAVTHRSYSYQGDHIRIRLFDNRMEVESPGRLPGSVRIDNIRHTRFSRNPRISRVLADLNLVQELNEGVNRMFEEMDLAGLPEPLLQQTDTGFKVTLFSEAPRSADGTDLVPENFLQVIDELHRVGHITNARAIEISGMSAPTVRRYLQRLADAGVIERIATSSTDPRAFWRLAGLSESD